MNPSPDQVASLLADLRAGLIVCLILVIVSYLVIRRRAHLRRYPPATPTVTPTPEEPPDSSTGADLPYTRRRYLLTQAEREFFDVLRVVAPAGWYVFPQVRLANLVSLRKGTHNWKPHFSRIAQKCVDFVLCDAADIGPRLVVELDDASHDQPDRQSRDAFVDAALRSAGLPILHVRWQRHYDATALASQIRYAASLPALPADHATSP